jgi:hypothetical protein
MAAVLVHRVRQVRGSHPLTVALSGLAWCDSYQQLTPSQALPARQLAASYCMDDGNGRQRPMILMPEKLKLYSRREK